MMALGFWAMATDKKKGWKEGRGGTDESVNLKERVD
jgi:hypothetical protein